MTKAPAEAMRIAFAGGGSGGHLVPAMAIAERLAELASDLEVRVLCSRRPIDHEWLERASLPHTPIPAEPLRPSPAGLYRFLRSHPRAVAEATAALRAHRAGLLVAVGGFASVPGVLAARRLGIPVLLVNLDVRPGRANRLIARIADRVVSTVPVGVRGRFGEVVGAAVRRAAIASMPATEARRAFGLDPHRSTLLVTGASHGAVSLNRFIVEWVSACPDVLSGWQIIHLTGGDTETYESAYRRAGMPAAVRGTIAEMGDAWSAATLAISRAGANSIAEIERNAVPSVLVPYPHHRDRHQWHNAAPLADAGGAVVVEDLIDPTRNLRVLGEACRRLVATPDSIEAMRSRLADRRSEDGAARIARLVCELAGEARPRRR